MKMYQWNGTNYSNFCAAYSDIYSVGNPPFPAPTGWQWVEGDLPQGAQPYIQLSLIQQIQNTISEGQSNFSSNPLPLDVQRTIYQLLSFLKTYFENNALHAMQAEVTAFSMVPGRTDMTQAQYDMVGALKQQILNLISAQLPS